MNTDVQASDVLAESKSARPEALDATRAPISLTFSVRPKRIAKILALLVLLIVVVGAIANLVIYNIAPTPDHAIAKLMKRFDLGHEPSIPNWYSSVALLMVSVLLAAIAKAEKIAASADLSRWIALSALFLLLAVDEAVMIHEMADRPMREWLNTGGFLHFAWVIPYSVFVLVLAVFFLPFLLRLEYKTRRLFLISAALFVCGAIGIELIEGVIVDALGVEGGFVSMWLTFAQVVEEALEMFAVVLFIYALLDYLQKRVNNVTFEHSKPSRQYDTNSGRRDGPNTIGNQETKLDVSKK